VRVFSFCENPPPDPGFFSPGAQGTVGPAPSLENPGVFDPTGLFHIPSGRPLASPTPPPPRWPKGRPFGAPFQPLFGAPPRMGLSPLCGTTWAWGAAPGTKWGPFRCPFFRRGPPAFTFFFSFCFFSTRPHNRRPPFAVRKEKSPSNRPAAAPPCSPPPPPPWARNRGTGLRPPANGAPRAPKRQKPGSPWEKLRLPPTAASTAPPRLPFPLAKDQASAPRFENPWKKISRGSRPLPGAPRAFGPARAPPAGPAFLQSACPQPPTPMGKMRTCPLCSLPHPGGARRGCFPNAFAFWAGDRQGRCWLAIRRTGPVEKNHNPFSIFSRLWGGAPPQSLPFCSRRLETSPQWKKKSRPRPPALLPRRIPLKKEKRAWHESPWVAWGRPPVFFSLSSAPRGNLPPKQTAGGPPDFFFWLIKKTWENFAGENAKKNPLIPVGGGPVPPNRPPSRGKRKPR